MSPSEVFETIRELIDKLQDVHKHVDRLRHTPEDFRIAYLALAASHDYLQHARAHDVTPHQAAVLKGKLGARQRELYRRQRQQLERSVEALLSLVPGPTGALASRGAVHVIRQYWHIFKAHERAWLSHARRRAVEHGPGILERSHEQMRRALRELRRVMENA